MALDRECTSYWRTVTIWLLYSFRVMGVIASSLIIGLWTNPSCRGWIIHGLTLNNKSPSEYRTSLVFRWLICVLKLNGPVFKWHLNTWQTCPVFKWSISLAYVLWSENRFIFCMVKNKIANFTIWILDCVQFSDGDCIGLVQFWNCPG
jgi:hypothetical protein